MRITIGVGAIVLALALGGCNSPAIPPGNYGNVAGTITSTSGQPIAGVTVQVDYGPSNASGPDGKYLVATVPISSTASGDHVAVTSVPNGYAIPPARDDVQVQAGQTTQVNFVLQRG